MRKLLLTGSQGFLASRFYEYYRDKYDFILLNRHNMDITDEAKIYRLFQEEDIDIVFHTAAIADIETCQDNPELARRINLQAAVNIAKGCALKNSILVFTSSDQVYSANTGGGPYTEEDIPLPGNIYAETKLEAEREIAAVMERFYHLRLAWMFSLLEKNKKTNGGIILYLIKALLNNTPINMSDNEFRSLTYVYEVIENFQKIIELPYGVYNTGSENDLSVYEIGEVILDALQMSHRTEDILHRVSGSRRDMRISSQKLKSSGVLFSDSEQAVRRCISDFVAK